MTSAINCPLWSFVYECQRVESAFTSPVRTECGMFVMYCIHVSCFVVCGYAVSRRNINIYKYIYIYIYIFIFIFAIEICIVLLIYALTI